MSVTITVSDLELHVLKGILEKADYEVYGGKELTTLYDMIKATQDNQEDLKAKFEAVDFTALIQHVSDVQDAVGTLEAGEVLDQADLDLLSTKADAAKNELDAISAQLQPTPPAP